MTTGGPGGGGEDGAIEFHLDVTGNEELRRRLSGIVRALERAVQLSTLDIQANIAEGPPQGAPVDTGTLAGSFVPYGSGLSWKLRSGVEYAAYVHDGTRFRKGNPYATRAITRTEQRVSEFVQRGLREAGVL